MTKRMRLRVMLQLCAFVGGAAALSSQEPSTVAEACAWCTGPYECTGQLDDGYDGCKIEGASKCEHTGKECHIAP